MSVMSFVIPGQKTLIFAPANDLVDPWCALWRYFNMSGLSSSGLIILEPFTTKLSYTDSSSWKLKRSFLEFLQSIHCVKVQDGYPV